MVWEYGSIPSYTDRIVMMRRLGRDKVSDLRYTSLWVSLRPTVEGHTVFG